ncbi:MAG: deoxyguanosinetriphosphate triphosphohydrolase [Thermomicrobiales bacterium]
MSAGSPASASIRARLEMREDRTLAARSRGAHRERPEPSSSLRTEFQRDRDRIIHTKSFRRLMHKTQVFISPEGDHYRTRLTHTLEVTQIARTIGRALDLNEDLIEAIGMGHDLGHTPFGHAGERALASVYPGFRHNVQSVRVVEKLEKDGEGLNLTAQVRDGILRHSKSRESIVGTMAGQPATLEGNVVKIADGVAYLNHDLDDSIRAGIIELGDVPRSVIETLGSTHAERINTLVADIVAESNSGDPPGWIGMSDRVQRAANELRNFLYVKVYDPINLQPETLEAQRIVISLFEYLLSHPERIEYAAQVPPDGETLERHVADVIASMTDRYAANLYEKLFVSRVLMP